MSEMPEGVMREARVLAGLLSIHSSDTDRIAIIARAIMAERERCARIAEDMLVTTDDPGIAQVLISAAIRGEQIY